MKAAAIGLLGVLGAIAWADIPRATTVTSPEKARDVLRRFLLSGESISMTAIVTQRAGVGAHEALHVKVVQDSQGRRRVEVLGPLRAQGTVSVDDGEFWKSYCPDTARLVVAPSPREERMDPETRLRLATQNYRFALEKNIEVAGRPAIVVVAVPRFSAMPTRRITLDLERAVLLRLETTCQGGDRDVLYDTKSISFATRFTPTTFALKPTEEVRVMRMEPPIRVSSAAEAKGLLGFTPVVPKQFRYGFVVREFDVAGSKASRYAALRLTDGLTVATLYQWSAKERSSPLGPDYEGVDRVLNGVVLRMVGDLSRTTRLQLLEGIANEYGKTFVPSMEPIWSRPTLKPKRDPLPSINIQACLMDALAFSGV